MKCTIKLDASITVLDAQYAISYRQIATAVVFFFCLLVLFAFYITKFCAFFNTTYFFSPGLESDMAHRKSRLHPVLSEHSSGLDSLHLPVGLLPSVLPIPSLP